MFNRPVPLEAVNLVTREEWGAKPPRWTLPIKDQPVHHYVVEYAARHPAYANDEDLSVTMRKLQMNHMKDKNCPDVKYNFLVGYDGRVWEGRGWTTQPTLPAKYDRIKEHCVLIGWIGKFANSRESVELPAPGFLQDTRRNLMYVGMAKKYISHILRIFLIKQDYAAPYLSVIPRHSWTTIAPSKVERLVSPVEYVVTTDAKCYSCFSIESCSRQIKFVYDKQVSVINRLSDIFYNFVIGSDGRVYECRGWQVRPDLPLRYQTYRDRALFIAFLGRFSDLNDVPTHMTEARDRLIEFGMEKKFIRESILLYNLSC